MSPAVVSDEASRGEARRERSALGRLRYTPLRDLARGRLTGRLDLDRVLDRCGLPAPLVAIVRSVVRATRLWRLEKIDVAEELIAHFAAGLEAGSTPEALVDAFGDPRPVARLIGRAKRRNRSRWWKVTRGVLLSLGALVLLYLGAGVYFLLGRPSPSTDFIPRLNAIALAVPEEDRAWPLYREALLGFERPDFMQKLDRAPRPGEEGWDLVVAYLDGQSDTLALVRRGAQRAGLGFPVGTSFTSEDAVLWPELAAAPAPDTPPLLISVLLPHLGQMRELSRVLRLDAQRAAADGDGATAVEDLVAVCAMAKQLREIPFVINDLIACALVTNAVETAGDILATRPEAFTDEDLRVLVHRLAALDTAMRVSLDAERMCFEDIIQNMYTDDGNGDGRLTLAGVRLMSMVSSISSRSMEEEALVALALPAANSVMLGRREMLEAHGRLLDAYVERSMRPLWEWEDDHVDAQVEAWAASPIDMVRYLPIVLLMPATGKALQPAELVRARRDGLLVAIAAELYRRQRETWPATAADLVPTLLPEVPRDRFDGQPLRYALVDGAPVVYSVGTDRNDDGGAKPPPDRGGKPRSRWMSPRWRPAWYWMSPRRLAEAAADPEATQPPDGDWILWPPEIKPLHRWPEDG